MERFGQYEIQSLIGRGGMGEVYRARDSRRNRDVALKLLPDAFGSDPEYARRFRRESDAAAQLREPHVIPIHDFGEVDGRLFIDMRLVDGQNLAALLADGGALAPDRAVAVVAQIAEALDAAHDSGLVHRDIKPANILVTPSDFVYVADFGIAYMFGQTQSHATRTGVAAGTLDYMAPERFTNGEISPRTDVYSLACVLFECLTAQKPFIGGDFPSQVYAHVYLEPRRASDIGPSVPAELDAVVARGMAKDPADRFESAGAFARAARDALRSAEPAPNSSQPVTPPPPVIPPEPVTPPEAVTPPHPVTPPQPVTASASTTPPESGTPTIPPVPPTPPAAPEPPSGPAAEDAATSSTRRVPVYWLAGTAAAVVLAILVTVLVVGSRSDSAAAPPSDAAAASPAAPSPAAAVPSPSVPSPAAAQPSPAATAALDRLKPHVPAGMDCHEGQSKVGATAHMHCMSGPYTVMYDVFPDAAGATTALGKRATTVGAAAGNCSRNGTANTTAYHGSDGVRVAGQLICFEDPAGSHFVYVEDDVPGVLTNVEVAGAPDGRAQILAAWKKDDFGPRAQPAAPAGRRGICTAGECES